jgi:hypothetical protein
MLFVLFATQLLIPDPRFRMYYSFLYIGLTIAIFAVSRSGRRSILGLFAMTREQ